MMHFVKLQKRKTCKNVLSLVIDVEKLVFNPSLEFSYFSTKNIRYGC